MKKRLLITSIVMMLVVAVALSTATYAWFTSNANVQGNNITLTASSSETAAIAIAWEGDDLGTAAITAVAPVGNINPMVPKALAVDTTKFADMAFNTATTRTSGGVVVFNEPSSDINPYQYKKSAEGNEYIQVKNTSATNNATVTLTLKDVAGNKAIADENELLRVAVFECTTAEGAGDYFLKAVMGVDVNLLTEWGTIVADAKVADLTADNAEVKTVTSYVFTLNANTSTYFKVIAWMDGVVLDDAMAGKTSLFGLNFAADKAE